MTKNIQINIIENKIKAIFNGAKKRKYALNISQYESLYSYMNNISHYHYPLIETELINNKLILQEFSYVVEKMIIYSDNFILHWIKKPEFWLLKNITLELQNQAFAHLNTKCIPYSEYHPEIQKKIVVAHPAAILRIKNADKNAIFHAVKQEVYLYRYIENKLPEEMEEELIKHNYFAINHMDRITFKKIIIFYEILIQRINLSNRNVNSSFQMKDASNYSGIFLEMLKNADVGTDALIYMENNSYTPSLLMPYIKANVNYRKGASLILDQILGASYE